MVIKRAVLLILILVAFTLVACEDEGEAAPKPTLTPTPTPTMACRIYELGGLLPEQTRQPPPIDSFRSTPTPTSESSPSPTPTPTLMPYCTPTPGPTVTPLPTSPGGWEPGNPQGGTSGGGQAGGGGGQSGGGQSGGFGGASTIPGHNVDSLTASMRDERLLDVNAGVGGMVVLWESRDELYMAYPGASIQSSVIHIGEGDDGALFLDSFGRVFIVKGKEGTLYFTGAPPRQLRQNIEWEYVGGGERPDIVVDDSGGIHLLYSSNGGGVLWRHKPYYYAEWSDPVRISGGGDVHAVYQASTGRVLAAIQDGNRIIVQAFDGDKWNNLTSQNGKNLQGPPKIDAHGDAVAVSWIEHEPDPVGANDWPLRRPEYKEAQPYMNRVHSGANAQQYFSTYGRHLAGVYQRVPTAPGAAVSAQAMYMAWSCEGCSGVLPSDPNPPSLEPAQMNVSICLDPQGGEDILSPSVICSGASNALDQWVGVSVSAVSQSNHVTLFLKSAPDLPRQNNDMYWDSVTLTGGVLVNGGMEGAFAPWNGIAELKVADGWTPFYIESEDIPVGSGRYSVKLLQFDGSTWGNTETVARNVTSTGRGGTMSGSSYPIIDSHNERVAVVYMYNEGDPDPSGLGPQIRYGKPSLVVCKLGDATKCSPGNNGARIIPSGQNMPSVTLIAATHSRDSLAHVVWSAFQGSEASKKDLYATSFSPHGLSVAP